MERLDKYLINIKHKQLKQKKLEWIQIWRNKNLIG
jgi:hypothetical protein